MYNLCVNTFHYKKSASGLVLLFMLAASKLVYAGDSQNQVSAELKRAIVNFDEIEPGFYRSGWLPAETYPYLKQAGIKTIVNFIDRKDQIREEKEALASLGIETISIPWNGFDYPKDEDVQKFLQITRDRTKRPLLVHCRRGAERTGVMVACWRIAEKDWRVEKAYQEMTDHGFQWFWYGHLKKYLYNFAKPYGHQENYSNNILTRLKTNALYGIYRVRKLFAFAYT